MFFSKYMACNGIELNGNESYDRSVFSFFLRKHHTILGFPETNPSLLPIKEKETQARKLWTMGKLRQLAASSGLSGKPHFCLKG